MGLDQYALVVDDNSKDEKGEEIMYWRKHNRLQGWMEDLWRRKTGDTGEFNCDDVDITEQDLDDLEKAIENDELPETGGFFFGPDSYENYECEYKEYDLEFIQKARLALAKGKKVVYTSWW